MEALAKAHATIIANDPEYTARVQGELNDEITNTQGFADPERKKTELSLPFYSAPEEVKAAFSNNNFSINIKADNDNNDSNGSHEFTFDDDDNNDNGNNKSGEQAADNLMDIDMLGDTPVMKKMSRKSL